jgi:hypothetical protein
MTPILLYLLKVNLVISILFLNYYFLVRDEKFFRLNRAVLLSFIGLAFLLPLLPAMKGTAESRLGRGMSDISPFIHWEVPSTEVQDGVTAGVHTPPPALPSRSVHKPVGVFTVVNIIEGLYMLTAVVLILRLLYQILQVRRVVGRSRREKLDGIIYCHHEMDLPVFSFFRCLVMNKKQYLPVEAEQIIAHEQVHIRQRHNFDLLLVEVLHALCWINPLLIGFKRAVKLNLEFIADQTVLDTGVDPQSYQYSILRCLRPSNLPLVNLFASSKIKIRIHMMNKKNSPMRNLYKYALALPLLAGAYFIVNPLKAKSMPLMSLKADQLPARQDLRAFEGYYQAEDNKDVFIQIRAEGDHLILRQLWDNEEIILQQQSALEFSGRDGKFPLKFSKNDKGEVVQVLVLNKDRWNKVKKYTPPTYIHLQHEQLKIFEGYYQMQGDDGKMDYIQIESAPDGLILRQGWDGKEIQFQPTSAMKFLGQNGTFPLEFTKDDKGNVTQVVAFHHDVWKKMQDPSGAVIKKQVMVEPGQLKRLEGEYQFQNGNKIRISAGREGIVLKQLWNNKEFLLVPSSSTEFFSKERSLPLVFTLDKSGVVTELLASDRDRWVKVKV